MLIRDRPILTIWISLLTTLVVNATANSTTHKVHTGSSKTVLPPTNKTHKTPVGNATSKSTHGVQVVKTISVIEKEEGVAVLDGLPEYDDEDAFNANCKKDDSDEEVGSWQHEIFVGEGVYYDELMFERLIDLKKPEDPNMQNARTVRMSKEGYTITKMEIHNLLWDDERVGECRIRKGGLNHSMVNVQMRSMPGSPLHYEIRIYGHHRSEDNTPDEEDDEESEEPRNVVNPPNFSEEPRNVVNPPNVSEEPRSVVHPPKDSPAPSNITGKTDNSTSL